MLCSLHRTTLCHISRHARPLVAACIPVFLRRLFTGRLMRHTSQQPTPPCPYLPPTFFFFTTPRGTRLVITASHRALHTKVASQSEACGGAAWSGIHASSTRGCDWHDAARPALQLCLLLVNRHLSLTHLPSSKTTQYLCHRMQRRLIAALFVRLGLRSEGVCLV